MSEEEKNEMAIRNFKLIYGVLKQLNLLDMSDELIDLGMIGLSRGIDNFKKEKGYKESTYLSTCIKREIIGHIRKELTLKRHKYSTVSLSSIISDTDLEFVETVADESINFEEEIEKQELFSIMEGYVNELKDGFKEVIGYSYGVCGYPKITITEMSERMGISKQAIFAKRKRALKHLRKLMKEGDIYGD